MASVWQENLAEVFQGVASFYVALMLWSFYYLLQEIVFFEVLFRSENGNQIHVFESNNTEGEEPYGRGGMLRDKEDLNEKLLKVRYDKTVEEEKILNTVFPSNDLQRF